MTYTDRYVIVYMDGQWGVHSKAVSDLWLDELRGHPDPSLRPAYRIRIREKIGSDAKKKPSM
jgi:hypothetical protein